MASKNVPQSVTETRYIVFSRILNETTRILKGKGAQGWEKGITFNDEKLALAELRWLETHNRQNMEYRLVSISQTRRKLILSDLDDEIPI